MNSPLIVKFHLIRATFIPGRCTYLPLGEACNDPPAPQYPSFPSPNSRHPHRKRQGPVPASKRSPLPSALNFPPLQTDRCPRGCGNRPNDETDHECSRPQGGLHRIVLASRERRDEARAGWVLSDVHHRRWRKTVGEIGGGRYAASPIGFFKPELRQVDEGNV